jgi:hypothetical protein
MNREEILAALRMHRRRVTRLHLTLCKYGDCLTPETRDVVERTIATTEHWIKLLETGLDPVRS